MHHKPTCIIFFFWISKILRKKCVVFFCFLFLFFCNGAFCKKFSTVTSLDKKMKHWKILFPNMFLVCSNLGYFSNEMNQQEIFRMQTLCWKVLLKMETRPNKNNCLFPVTWWKKSGSVGKKNILFYLSLTPHTVYIPSAA